MTDRSSAVLPALELGDACHSGSDTGFPATSSETSWSADGNLPAASAVQCGGDLVEHVAHELRSPLTVINEYAFLLRDEVAGELNEQQRRMLEIITDRAQDLNAAVDDLVDMSRLQSGTLCVSRHNCRVTDLVNNIQSRLQRKSTTKQVAFQVDVPAELPQLYCDEERISRVIFNIASDAIKACTPAGSVRLWSQLDQERREITIGVTHEREATGFSPFDSPGSANGSAHGEDLFWSGLKVSRELVEVNLGTMHADRGTGQQITIRLTFPIAEPFELMTRHIDRLRRLRHRHLAVSLLMAGTPGNDGTCDEADTFLGTLPGPDDLVLRIDRGAWLVAVTGDQEDLNRFLRWGDHIHSSLNRKRSADRPLASIAMETLGTWTLPKDRSHLLDAVRRVLETLSTRSKMSIVHPFPESAN